MDGVYRGLGLAAATYRNDIILDNNHGLRNGRPVISASLEMGDEPITLYNAHLKSGASSSNERNRQNQVQYLLGNSSNSTLIKI